VLSNTSYPRPATTPIVAGNVSCPLNATSFAQCSYTAPPADCNITVAVSCDPGECSAARQGKLEKPGQAGRPVGPVGPAAVAGKSHPVQPKRLALLCDTARHAL